MEIFKNPNFLWVKPWKIIGKSQILVGQSMEHLPFWVAETENSRHLFLS